MTREDEVATESRPESSTTTTDLPSTGLPSTNVTQPEEVLDHSGSDDTPSTPVGQPATELPTGYRQGIITATTVFISFALAMLRYEVFEDSRNWTAIGYAATAGLVIGLIGLLNTLFRSLRLEDNNEVQYRTTCLWFKASVAVASAGMLISLILSMTVFRETLQAIK